MGKYFLALLIIAVIVVGVFSLRTEQNREPDSVAPADFKPVEVKFNNQLVFQKDSMAIDNGGAKVVNCNIDSEKSLSYGYFQTPDGTKLELKCLRDYMGGISVTYTNAQGEIIRKDLAQQEGDAGDEWDTRSWLIKDGNKLSIRTVILSSSSDIEDSVADAKCNFAQKILTWDAKSKDFVEAKDTPDFDAKQLAKPIMVDKSCMTASGDWK